MRNALTLGVCLLALAACSKKTDTAAATGEAKPAAAAAPAPTTGPPHRKPGLWAQTIATAGMNQTTKVCLDTDTEAKMTVWGEALGKSTCSKNSFAPAPGGWSFESVCELGAAGTIASKGAITGDFDTAYTMKISSTTTGASAPQANGTHEMTLTAKWEGPCPAGVKGGDIQMTMPDGQTMTINAEQAAAMRK